MSIHGLGNGVDLVKRMTKVDFETSWVMFNHINWTTMKVHVYDPFCYHLWTIALCEMKINFFESQSLFWLCLNEQLMQV